MCNRTNLIEYIGKTASSVIGIGNPPLGVALYAATELSQILFSFSEGRGQIRCKKVVSFLEEAMMFIENEIEDIDQAFLEGEYFIEVLEKIFIKVANNTSEYKKDIFKQIFKNEIKRSTPNGLSATFLNMIPELDDVEIKMLKYISENQLPLIIGNENNWINVKKIKEHLISIGIDQAIIDERFEMYLYDLKFKGLLSNQELIGIENIRVTPLSEGLIKYIKAE